MILESDLLKKSGVEEISLDADSLEEMNVEVSDKVYESLAELNKALKQTNELQNQAINASTNVYANKINTEILHLYSSIFLKDFKNKFLTFYK